MRVLLVTGGAGFIARTCATRCSPQGHEVLALDDLSSGRRENLDPRVHLVAQISVRHSVRRTAIVPSDRAPSTSPRITRAKVATG